MTEKKIAAARIVANNWRIRRRLPRITAYAGSLGLIPFCRAEPLTPAETEWPFQGTPVGQETDPDTLAERRTCPDCGLAVNERGRTREEEDAYNLHDCRGWHDWR